MKKLLAGLLAVAMLFALTACGGNGGASEEENVNTEFYAGFYHAAVPEGFEMKDKIQTKWERKVDGKVYPESIELTASNNNPDKEMAQFESNDRFTMAENVTIGKNTWNKTFKYTDQGYPCTYYYMYNEDKNSFIRVRVDKLENEEEIEKFMKSLKFEEDAANKLKEFRKTAQ